MFSLIGNMQVQVPNVKTFIFSFLSDLITTKLVIKTVVKYLFPPLTGIVFYFTLEVNQLK